MRDLVTFGEAMVRLSPPNFGRLEQARGLDVNPGGGEYNVAVASARLGLRAAWVSRLPDNPLGRLVRNKAREHGVDTDSIVWAKGSRMGLYFVEFGAAPRASSVLYDRARSAIAEIQAGEIDWNSILGGTRAFHVSGITPALSDSAAQVTREALEAARRAGCLVSYDLNYRSKLWKPDKAARVQEPFMRLVDLLITTEEDARVVFGISPQSHEDATYTRVASRDYESVARQLQKRFGFKAVAITLRESPGVWRNNWSALVHADDRIYTAPRFEVEIVDRIGAGDSFAAGLLYSYLTESSWEKAVAFGVGLSALKHSVMGDLSWFTREEVEAVLAGGGLRVAR